MLTVEDFSIVYDRDGSPLPAVSGTAFSLAAGESLGIIGESGCGKTTLALGIMGLLPGATVSGRVLLHGRDLTAMAESERRRCRWRHIAMLFQNSLEVLNPVITIGEQLTEPLIAHLGLTARQARERVTEMLAATGLAPRWLAAYPHQMSGGMRQKALLAMALACGPELLIVDEPTTSLDPESRQAVLDLLQDLQSRLGFAMIMISHNLPAIRRLTGRLLTMYAGRVVEEGDTAEVLRRPLHPYTRGLINAAPDFFPYKDLWGIPGVPPRAGSLAGCGFAPRCCQAGDFCAELPPELREQGSDRRVACHKGGIETVLSAHGMVKTYRLGDEAVKAIKGVDLVVRHGEVVALVGRSGSGKSTLAQMLVRVLPADGGMVHFFGRSIFDRQATAVIGGMQMVFQDPAEAVSHRLSVLEAVREPLDIMGHGERGDRERRAMAALAAMHLPTSTDFLRRTCHGLSGGQRQRVAIARALVTEPALLVADEITAMLDPSTQAVILRELKGLQHQRGFSMLFISHDMHLARKVADRVYVLDQGYIVEEGAAFEVLNGPADSLAMSMPAVTRN
ncbi:MAG: ABC transporter ATP-binding protein [Desulfobulbaceae bacterium BRH_c16a]|nr:MAG: ABC transporter ATP-binding protein [Desulfobulbaceae bacterium BRH_c16a]